MTYERLIVEKSGGIAKITLNRPEKLNAIDVKLGAELYSALEDIQRDEDIGVVILKGNGRAFCAGRDLSELGSHASVSAEEQPQMASFSDICSMIEDINKPVIAAVHGYAITGGFLLAYSCDLIIAGEDAQFADTHALWGLIPGGGESQRLPRRIGPGKAKELLLTSDFMSAREAERCGLVNEVVPVEKLDEAATALARKILNNNRSAVSALKFLVNQAMKVDFDSGIKLEMEVCKNHMANIEPDKDRDMRLEDFRQKKKSAKSP